MLITFEGTDFSGKSTQIGLLAQYLNGIGCEYYKFREPGGTEFGDEIRGILLQGDYQIDNITNLLLFEASRRELFVKKIRPLLYENKLVILDRFFDSTIVYQGLMNGVDIDLINTLNLFVTDGVKPDLTFYLEISKDTYVSRSRERYDLLDNIEKQIDVNAEMIITAYKTWYTGEYNKSVILINANRDTDSIHEDIINRLNDELR